MRPESQTIDPILTDDEREELRHLDYLSARTKDLLDRGLIALESYAAIDADGRQRRNAIEHRGRYVAAISRARSLARGKPQEALTWAERARELDPSDAEASVLAVDLLWSMERDDEAVSLCDETVGRFPHLDHKLETLRSRVPERANARRARAEQARLEQEMAGRLADARTAFGEGRGTEAVELCREVLAAFPDRVDALQMAAHSLHELGRTDEAIELYQRLANLQPRNPVWSNWVRNLTTRRRLGDISGTSPRPEPDGFWVEDRGGAAVMEAVAAPPPPWSWSSFAAEFLEEHWQKLILCLAVLLIVVSSTVGAHLLLGPLLWLPAGKCALALVWTVAFAAMGWGLVQWGAERAGQMMLVATLIVVPIHFMLLGELKLVTGPTAAGVVVAAVDGLALVALVRWISGVLVPRGQARFLSAALLLLSVGSVMTARGAPVSFGWQFAAFLAPAVVLLGAVECLGVRRWGDSDDAHRQFAILVLGLLGFAFLACTVRIGAYTLRLEPALYAVPVMLGAIATVEVSRLIAPYETDARRLAGIRFAGYVLSALAFALAMAPPPVPSALFSANTVAASLLGFVLYTGALHRERHPAFLYLSIAALMAARVGAHYFLADRIRLVIDAVGQWLGYEQTLPWAYLAVLGLIANPALAALGIWFRRGWTDDRLARHCRYIGLPVAVAACLWSCQEPEAATIVLSGYSVLFHLAVWLYAVPLLSYAGILSLCGAAYFGSTLAGGWSAADQALMAAAMAWLSLGVSRLVRRVGAEDDYAVPWIRAGRALSAVALVVATVDIALEGAHSASAALAFLLVGTLNVIETRAQPQVPRADLALLCFVEFTICGLALLTGGRSHTSGTYGLLLVSDGLVLLAAGALLHRVKDPAGTANAFLVVIPRFVIALTLVADCVALMDGTRSWMPGIVWVLGGSAFLGVTRWIPDVRLVYAAIAHLVTGELALSHWAMPLAQSGLSVGWLAVNAAAMAVVVWGAGAISRRHGVSRLYVSPCLNASLGLTLLVLALAVGSRVMLRDAYRFGVLALAVNAMATILLSATWRRFELTYAAILHVVVATYIILFSVGHNDPRMAFVLGLAAVIEAVLCWGLGFACGRFGGGRLRPYARPLYHATVVLTFLGILLADRSGATLALAAVAFLLTVKSLPHTAWLYGTVACLGAACYFRWLSDLAPDGLMLSTTIGAFVLWTGGVLGQRHRTVLCHRLGLRPLAYETPLFHGSVVAALMVLTIRVSLSGNDGAALTAYAWLPLSLSLLSLLMIRAYPRRGWMHGSLVFLAGGTVSVVSPSLTSLAAIMLAGATMALVLSLLDQAVRDHEPAICHHLGIVDVGCAGVVRSWSAGLFGLAAVLMIAIVLAGMAAAFGLAGWPASVIRPADWWMLLIASFVTACHLAVMANDPESGSFVRPEGVLTGLHAVLVLDVWWLGVSGSPLSRWLPPASDWYPIVTAVAALAAIHLGRQWADPGSWHELAWVGDVRSPAARRAMGFQATFLALLAVVFTGLAISGTTVTTMVMASFAIGLAAFMNEWPIAAGMASIAWAGAWSVLGVLLARHLGFLLAGQQSACAAIGAVVSSFLLWRWAGALRHGTWTPKSRLMPEDAPAASVGREFARVVEGVASASTVLASSAVLATGPRVGESEVWVASVGVGVLFGGAILHVLLAPRWRSEWPVYVAQALMVGAYVQFRMAFPLSNAADAAVLTLLGYLDMAIAEALDRLDRTGYYTRPTRFGSLVLPMLPLLQLFTIPGRNDVSVFYLAAAATFYATACGRLRWKSLGYAAAVFANAALWMAWSRLGWMLTMYPQLYLVPVGLSAILFAEVNRELGRPAVNLIRSVGLTVIYVSLALPIWQFESFGAWLTLLLVSLLGVFIGIGLRLQTFLWLGLTSFVLDVVYEMGRVSLDYAMAKWAIMLALGIALVLFVALNEKKRILSQMLDYYAHVRTWE